MDNMQEDYLEHWGVKGMRWGFRKKRKESKSSSNESHGFMRSISADQARYNELSRKKYYEMSNKEMNEYKTRRQLIDDYTRLQEVDRKANRSKGQAFVEEAWKLSKKAVIDGGKEYASNAIKETTKKMIAKGVSSALSKGKNR